MTDRQILIKNGHILIVILDTIWALIVIGTILMTVLMICVGNKEWLHLVAITFVALYDGIVKTIKSNILKKILKQNDR